MNRRPQTVYSAEEVKGVSRVLIKDKSAHQQPLAREGSITEAYIKYELAIKRFVSRFLPGPCDVEDVYQEAFLKAYTAERAREIEQPKSYLFRVAKHIAISRLRKEARQPLSFVEDFEALNTAEETGNIEDEVMAHQQLGLRCEAVATLSPQVRRVYLMRKVYGMSYKDIALRLNIATSTVEKHLSRGVKQCERYVRERVLEEQGMAEPQAASMGNN